MRKSGRKCGLTLVTLVLSLLLPLSILNAKTDWPLLEEGAGLLGEARGWVKACEDEQLGRFESVVNSLRTILEDAGLSKGDLFRFESALEAAEQLSGDGSGVIDCSNPEPRIRVADAMEMISQAIGN